MLFCEVCFYLVRQNPSYSSGLPSYFVMLLHLQVLIFLIVLRNKPCWWLHQLMSQISFPHISLQSMPRSSVSDSWGFLWVLVPSKATDVLAGHCCASKTLKRTMELNHGTQIQVPWDVEKCPFFHYMSHLVTWSHNGTTYAHRSPETLSEESWVLRFCWKVSGHYQVELRICGAGVETGTTLTFDPIIPQRPRSCYISLCYIRKPEVSLGISRRKEFNVED